MDSEEFYKTIAEKCGLEKLDSVQANTAYRVRDQARYSFERKGPTPSPYTELVSRETWNHTQESLSEVESEG